MPRFVFFILLLFTSFSSISERIKPRCTLSSADKKGIFTLIRPIHVTETKYHGPGSYEVCFALRVKTANLVRMEMIPSGTTLFDSSGNNMGFISADYFPPRIPTPADSGYHWVWIRGFVPAFALDLQTVAEVKLSKLINSQKKEFTKADLTYFFTTFGVFQERDLDRYTSFALFESPCFFTAKKYRLLFIFDGESLCAIVHRREVSLIHFESKASNQPYSIYFMKKMNQEEKNKLTSLYLTKDYR